ncbi:hypothetical protein FNV43_RR19901 [Rhamnella rubrinervis]|uniref:Bowman-Birk serine protease inhibitors family domain-containing protein n=1 Tax=Rhamnella rubrinervis TaxID=2594499 RepID=A0A8K0DZD0_9ROSA|nr:hypothetical protein FNV43_RR19901 [Rhamnella rubrinervis]
MALKKVAVLSMAVLFLLVAVSTSVSAARANHVLDISELLSAKNQDFSKSSAVRVVRGKNVRGDNTEACCDSCICTRSIPPKCRCTDIFDGTDRCKGCDLCICTPNLLSCRCADMTDSCKPPCSSSATTTFTTNEEAKKNYVASN